MLRTVLLYGAALLGLVIGVEALSAAAVYAIATIQNNENLRVHLNYFHPLWNRKHTEAQQGGIVGLHQAVYRENPFTFSPHTGFDLAPNTVLHTYLGAGTLRVSPDGFACNAACERLPRAKPAGEVRVFIMGGSVVMGTNDGADGIGAVLEGLLKSSPAHSGKTVRVINAGVGGFFAPQQLVKLNHQILTYEPDMVIWLDGHNDYRRWQSDMFYKSVLPEYQGLLAPNFHDYDYSLIVSVQRLRSPSGSLMHTLNLTADKYPLLYYTAVLARYARRVFLLGSPLNPKWTPETSLPPDRIGERLYARDINSVRNYLGAVDSAAGILRARGIQGLFCFQPVFFIERKAAIAPEENGIVPTKSEFAYLDDYYAAARAEFARRREVQDGGIRYCDLTPVFRSETRHIYTDQVHLTPLGNRLVAEALYRETTTLAR